MDRHVVFKKAESRICGAELLQCLDVARIDIPASYGIRSSFFVRRARIWSNQHWDEQQLLVIEPEELRSTDANRLRNGARVIDTVLRIARAAHEERPER